MSISCSKTDYFHGISGPIYNSNGSINDKNLELTTNLNYTTTINVMDLSGKVIKKVAIPTGLQRYKLSISNGKFQINLKGKAIYSCTLKNNSYQYLEFGHDKNGYYVIRYFHKDKPIDILKMEVIIK